ncbi:hypothetical protein BV25DRAFT_1818779 [Artomyces pyxidatus]|uniref:Uncharacterized protein n=1 Tax=Artomyces pyxidatus TaxID=48021 RepID=A0ACB8TIT2_9AGAM|nr:hypothetical protein BV25DRAFT_1818779 [Artomyces pyxidatus]
MCTVSFIIYHALYCAVPLVVCASCTRSTYSLSFSAYTVTSRRRTRYPLSTPPTFITFAPAHHSCWGLDQPMQST